MSTVFFLGGGGIINIPVNYTDDDRNGDRNVLVSEQDVIKTFYVCAFVVLIF